MLMVFHQRQLPFDPSAYWKGPLYHTHHPALPSWCLPVLALLTRRLHTIMTSSSRARHTHYAHGYATPCVKSLHTSLSTTRSLCQESHVDTLALEVCTPLGANLIYTVPCPHTSRHMQHTHGLWMHATVSSRTAHQTVHTGPCCSAPLGFCRRKQLHDVACGTTL